ETYLSRMPEGQDKIYYITADSFTAAKSSPHLEIFRKKGIEVLLLADRVDEWLVSSLTEFDGKSLVSVTKGELDLGSLEATEDKASQEKSAEELKGVIDRIKETLGDRVKDVRTTFRLTSSPACLVNDAYDMSANLERILKAAGQQVASAKPILELNPDHPLIKQLSIEADNQRFTDWTHILFDQALLSEGGQLEDPAAFVSRLNQMLLDLAAH
ncbi:MAG: molecular chaperone HtpG, partial [Gammaproteobacteria bacterium]|nr:molecular chaperone HtpG [Gammaproteobacteria bacterium]